MIADREVQAHLRRHAAIEASLEDELKRPLPDFDRVKRLKRHKLAIKDAVVRKQMRDAQQS